MRPSDLIFQGRDREGAVWRAPQRTASLRARLCSVCAWLCSVCARLCSERILFGALFTLFTPFSLFAHSLSISRGTLTLQPDHVDINLEVHAEDFLHFYPVAGPEGVTPGYLNQCLAEFRTELLTNLHLYDLEGDRLPVTIESAEWSEPLSSAIDVSAIRQLTARYELRANWTSTNIALALRQTLGAALAGYRSQMVLDVQSIDGRSITSLTLTNGGNAEAMTLGWPKDPALVNVAIFPMRDRIRMNVKEEAEWLRIEVEISLPLLDRILPIRRVSDDHITKKEFEFLRERALESVQGALGVGVNQSRLAASDSRVACLGLNGVFGLRSCFPTERIGSWTATLQITMNYPIAGELSQLDLDWSIFNAAIIMVDAELEVGGTKVNQTLTRYTPRYRWSPASVTISP